jgi:hypothetical protein
MSSILKARAWRKHPLFQYGPQHMLIGLPTGIAMFAGVTLAEKAGLITWDKESVDTTTRRRMGGSSGAFPSPARISLASIPFSQPVFIRFAAPALLLHSAARTIDQYGCLQFCVLATTSDI